MRYPAKLLGLVAATALFTPLSPLPPTPALLPPALAQGESAGDRKAEADRLFHQGIQQYDTSQFREALQSWEQALAIYREPRVHEAFPEESRQREAAALYNLGLVYNKLRQYEQALAIYREPRVREAFPEESRQREAAALYNLGLQHNRLGQYEQAINTYQQSLAITREIGDRVLESYVLGDLGIAYRNTGQYEQAISLYEQQLAITRDISDRAEEGRALGNLGSIYDSLAQYDRAIDFYQQALAIFRDIGDRHREATALSNLGIAYASLGQFERAIDFYRQHLTIARDISDRREEAKALNNLGGAYRFLGQYERAIDFHQQALAIARDIGDSREEAYALDNLGNTYSLLGQYEQAIDFHQQALVIVRNTGNRWGEAYALNHLGNTYNLLGQYERAIDFHQQALAIFLDIRDLQGETVSLGNLGNAYFAQGKYERAIDFHQQALAIDRDIGNRWGEAASLNNLAGAYFSLSQYERAIDFHQQALAIARDIGDPQLEADTLGNLGASYLSLGQYERAIDFFQQHLAIAREIVNQKGEVTALGNLGVVYFFLGEYKQAIDFHQQALAIAQDIGDRAGEGRALNNLGITYRSLGQYERAIDFHEQSLAIRHDIGDRGGEAASLGNLGLVYASLGDYERAIDFYQQSLSLTQAIGSQAETGIALSNLGHTFAQLEQPDLAIVFLKASVNVRELIRGGLTGLPQALQQSYTDSVADTYRRLADLLLARGDILEAQQVLELLKVQELQEFTRGRVTNIETREFELDDAEEVVMEAHTNLVTFGLERDKAEAACEFPPSANCDEARLAELDEHYEMLSAAFNQAVDDLNAQRQAEQEARRAREDEQVLQARQELDPDGFQGTAGVLAEKYPGTVLVYPVVLDDKLWILWGSAGGVAVPIEVPVGRQQIGEAVLQFRTLMEACEWGGCDARAIPAVQAVAQELHNYLIPELLEQELQALQATLPEGQVPNLVIVPDLVTRYIPFAALHDGEHYLIENYTVSTLLGAEQTETDNPLRTLDETSVLGLGLSNPVPEHGFRYPLDNVPDELATIVKETETEPGIYRGETFLNEAFSQASLRLARRHQVLHIATHGVFEPNADDQSYLMLGIGEPLYIRELETATDYFRNLSLVVLSACETALADVDQSGLELASIASTFLRARVDTVVASLWQVSDQATSDLMQQFYANLAQSTPEQRVSVSQALRQAQLSLLYGNQPGDPSDRDIPRATIDREYLDVPGDDQNLPRTAHPYYWSPFIIIGNGL
ncbi:hypothetical protein XM38_052360 [Halomicronema hongdechloris C2206]|uniref:CHAT domain-containing protein n=1 Tax=Halomicronema hongdechloris C2206 TaxID=1641165 RepID=A0A1Z3HVC0_9CYAN|nr:tetratricopeptide repeat protein [Halomicronema hongdechloris]ASC74261.1 hypothetical protein XM38_052360 [Halomicronema hongdechloris C2206]